MSDIGKRIKERREKLHLTQEQLADKLGYKSKSTINKIEMGINDITQSKIIAFAKALGVTPAYLLGWEDEDIPIFKNDSSLVDRLEDPLDDKSKTLMQEYLSLSHKQRAEVNKYLEVALKAVKSMGGDLDDGL